MFDEESDIIVEQKREKEEGNERMTYHLHTSHRIEDIVDQPYIDDAEIARAVAELKGRH